MIERIKERAPRAKLDGVLISPMVRGGVEMILGVQNDPVFGPVVMLGLGGIFVEVLRDVTFRIAPFGVEEAHRMIGELRGRGDARRGPRPAALRHRGAGAGTVETVGVRRRQERRVHQHRHQPALVRPRGEGAAALDALILTPETVSGDDEPTP